ncbi:MAG: Gfo/Idh/MocA family oxidoreductase [Candidatus Hydrogenedens sp.]|nr:Gfo/Idh/MocA family oxidoreductase [Candidatus Hydrogenedens sp.]
MEHSQMKKHQNMSRRSFIKTTATGLIATASVSAVKSSMAQNNRLGIGVIGCGGRGTHLSQVVKHLQDNDKTVQFKAFCDIYRPRLDKLADIYGGKKYMDYRELLNDKEVDVVIIATPDHHHARQTIEAVKAGKHVYCEKPMTHWTQWELAKQMTEAVKQSDCVFQIGTQAMSDSVWKQMKELVEQGKIGQPVHVECGYFRLGDWGERGMPIDDPNAKPGPDLNWDAFLEDAPKREFDVSRFFRWRMYADYAGGMSTDLYPHILTPVVYTIGVHMPKIVVGIGGKLRYEEREIPDTFDMLINYDNKTDLALLGTQANEYQGTSLRGQNRVPVIRGWEGTLTINEEDIVFWPAKALKTQNPEKIPIQKGENLTDYLRSFIDCCVRKDKNTLSPIDMAFEVQTTLIMGMLSWKNSKMYTYEDGKGPVAL